MERGIEQSQLEVESKEKEPKIFYHFFYAPHRTAKDFENLKNAFAKADIYVPEAFGWSPIDQKLFQEVADGRISPKEALKVFGSEEKKSARMRELKIIYNSKKPILLADITYDDALINEFKKADLFFRKAGIFFMEGHFKESLEQFKFYLKSHVEFQLKREEKIKINLENKLKEFLKNNSLFAKKKDLRVLINLGFFHTKIYQEFKKENMPVSREFSKMPIVYQVLDEVLRRIIFNKKVDDELLARGIIEAFIDHYLLQLTSDTTKAIWVGRKISSQLLLKDIEQISKDFAKNPNLDIVKELEKFGIKVPKSKKEIDKIMDSDKNKRK